MKIDAPIEIGDFRIEAYDKDSLRIVRGIRSDWAYEAIIDGGDFETFLEALFVQPRVTSFKNEDR